MSSNPRESLLRLSAALSCFGFWFFLPNTQWRLGSIGLSELFGLLATVVAVNYAGFRFTAEMTVAFVIHVVIVGFTFANIVVSDSPPQGALRDIVAVSYSLVVSVSVANIMARCQSALNASIAAMIAAVILYAIILIGAVAGVAGPSVWFLEPDSVGPDVVALADAHETIPRFVGISANPNQLAFFLAFVGCFVLATVRLAGFRHVIMTRLVCSILVISLIIATRSDGAILALAAGFTLIAFGWVFRLGGGWAVLCVYLSLIGVGIFSPLIWEWGLGDDGGGGRLALWRDALVMFNDKSGLGLGYGSHIPSQSGVAYEAHSLPLDLMLGAGVFGCSVVLLIVIYYGRKLLFGCSLTLIAPAIVVMMFGLTYSPMRNPLFWVALFLPALLDQGIQRVRKQSRRRFT